jgi:hypothetical protein
MNWFEKILESPQQAGQALSEGMTIGLSKVASPAIGQAMAKAYAAIDPNMEMSDVPSRQESYKIYNDQRQSYKKENPFLNMALEATGALPATIAFGGKSIGGQMLAGGLMGGGMAAADVASRSIGNEQMPTPSDALDVGVSSAIGAAASPIGYYMGKGISTAVNKGISPVVKDIYSKLIDKDPGVQVLMENLKKLPKEKIGKIKDFLGKSEAGDYKALTETMQKDIDKGFREGIKKEVNPRYNKIFYRANKQGSVEPFKLPPSQVTSIYQKENYADIYQSIKSGLENDVRIEMPNGQIAPENSLAYTHAVRSQAKGLLNKIKRSPDPNLANRLAQENNLRNFIKELDTTIDRNVPTLKKTDLALVDERYSKLINQKEAAMNNLGSGEITKTNKDRILSYAGQNFEPHLDTLDLVNKTYKKSGMTQPTDAFREGSLAVNLATGNKMGAIRDVGKIAAKRMGTIQEESKIGDFGNFLTSDDGKSLISKLYDTKTLADRNEAIKTGINTFAERGAQSLGIQAADDIAQGVLPKKDRSVLKLSEFAKPQGEKLSVSYEPYDISEFGVDNSGEIMQIDIQNNPEGRVPPPVQNYMQQQFNYEEYGL